MKCDLCGNPTGKFFSHYHPECAAAFKKQWALMGKCIDDYNANRIGFSAAKEQFILASEESHTQKLFWSHIYSRNELRTYDKLVFSQNFICVSEEKNRCHMERTGLSYAKYPQWEHNSQRICYNGTIALTDSGVYILGEATYYIPYGKIIDVGLKSSSWFGQSAYFDVKTSSSRRHRYLVSALDKKFKNIALTVYDILRFMVGLRAQDAKTHLINTPPHPMDLMFELYAPDPIVLPHTEINHNPASVNVSSPVPVKTQVATVNGNYQKHRWTMAEDELCCRKYLEWYVMNHSSMGLLQFVQELEKSLPDISTGSLRMKTQNIKQLCIEHGIRDSLDAKPLAQYSRQNAAAFQRVKTEFGL